MVIDLDSPVVQSTVAAAVGVSKQAISAMVNDGALPPCDTNGQLLLAYCERLRDQAAGRLGNTPDGLDLVQERAMLARHQGGMAELKLAEMRGELIRTDAVRGAWAARIVSTREALLQIPARIAPVLAAENDLVNVTALLDYELRQALAELSRPKSEKGQ